MLGVGGRGGAKFPPVLPTSHHFYNGIALGNKVYDIISPYMFDT